MMAALHSRTVAALLLSQFVYSTAATRAYPKQAGGTVQQPLSSTGCLPGPLKLDTYPTCATVTGDEHAVPWAPWTSRPYCVEDTSYCVFTNADFPGPSRGLSIIDVRPDSSSNATTAVASIAQLLSSPAPASNTAGEEPLPYEVQDIPGKGKCLVATRKILRGQVFMVDYAAVVADARFPSRVKRDQGRQMLREAIERLPGAEEVLSLARSSSDPDNVPVVEDVMRTNSFTVEIVGREYMALFPRIAVSPLSSPRGLT
jgi:hypothetical protein